MVMNVRLGLCPFLKTGLLVSLMSVVVLLAGCAHETPEGYAVYRPRSDQTVQANIQALWQKSSPSLVDELTLQISDGVVTVAGGVESEPARITALQDIWNAEGVREVVNEIRVTNPANSKLLAKDNGTAVKLRTRLTFDQSITSVDYSIEVTGNTVYLMGRAQSADELGRVISYANSMPGIENVISDVKIRTTL
jgi:osmotically-inducible protein OsmY